MEKTILLLEEMGCNFNEDWTDLNNYRYVARGLYPKANKKPCLVEINKGCLINVNAKKPVVHNKALNLSVELLHSNTDGNNYKINQGIYKTIQEQDYRFNIKDLKTMINTINSVKISKVLITKNIYHDLENISGYREKDILNNCVQITETMHNKDHWVIKFYDINSNTFEYDIMTNKIVGWQTAHNMIY